MTADEILAALRHPRFVLFRRVDCGGDKHYFELRYRDDKGICQCLNDTYLDRLLEKWARMCETTLAS